jgi:hypothetical protein
MIELIISIIFLFFGDAPVECRYPQWTPADREFMHECSSEMYSSAQCYTMLWESYQLGHGLEMPVTWA